MLPSFRVVGAVILAAMIEGCATRAIQKAEPAAPAVPPTRVAGAEANPASPVSPRRRTTSVRGLSPSVTARTQAVADTAAAGSVVRRCRAQRLLPEAEATMDAIVDLLRQARAALVQKNIESAASYARSAKQLSTSLRCP
jgi:hypothetical protein